MLDVFWYTISTERLWVKNGKFIVFLLSLQVFSNSNKANWVSEQPQPESAGGVNILRDNLQPTRDSSHCSQMLLLAQVFKQTSLKYFMLASQEVLTKGAPAAHGRHVVPSLILPLPHSCPPEWPPKYSTYTQALLYLCCRLWFSENLSP